MFCPKCGTQNPETGKFCRACGTDVENVSAVMSGTFPATIDDAGRAGRGRRRKRRQDPGDVQGDALKNIITAFGFLLVAIALAISGIGRSWWWAMLFPFVFLLARGIPAYIRYERMLADRSSSNAAPQPLMNQPQPQFSLPPDQTAYIQPESQYKTSDLVPPSVTDGTTRHLEINSEGETMTLPEKP
jgi:hypothetical protein